MKLRRPVSLSALFFACAPLVTLAGPIDSAVVAAMRLAEVPSYAWVSEVQDDATSYAITGKALKNGYRWVTRPMIADVSSRLGRECDTELETFFYHSPDRCVLRAPTGWLAPHELPKPRDDDHMLVFFPTPTMSIIADPSQPADLGANGIFAPRPLPPPIIIFPVEPDEKRPFSNAQIAVNVPHEELQLIVSGCNDMKVDDSGVVSGSINDISARLLLAPAERKDITPLLAAGVFKLWIKDNIVDRYELHLEAVFLAGKKKVLVRQLSETSLKDIGRTSFTVPDAVRMKLAH